MSSINVRIITADAAVAIGLKQTLLSLFDIDAEWLKPSGELRDADMAGVDLFITDADSFAAMPGFFIPKRAKLALLTDSTDDTTGFILNRHCDEQTYLNQLSEIVETTRSNRNEGAELSQREIEVLCQLAKGLTNKEIADKLFISINTVLTHRKNISAKLGIRSVSGLSVYAIMNGYISDIPEI